MLTLALALLAAQEKSDAWITIDELLVDSLIYENVAVTKMRIVMRNDGDRLDRAVALTLATPADAVAYELDSYGAVDGDRQTVATTSDGISQFMRMADAARSGEYGTESSPLVSWETLRTNVRQAIDELQSAGRFSQLIIRFVMTDDKRDQNPEPAVTTFSYRLTPRMSPTLLQKAGDGRYQLMMYPLPKSGEQTFEVYFCHFVPKNDQGVYAIDLPFDVKGRHKVRSRIARVRIVTEGELSDVAVKSHKTELVPIKKRGKDDPQRVEIRLAGEDSFGNNPVRLSYVLDEKAKPVDPGEPEAALKKKWNLWTVATRKEEDPLLDPAAGLNGFVKNLELERVRRNPDLTPEKRDEEMRMLLQEGRIASKHSSILVASNDLLWAVGQRPPKEIEKPFRSPRKFK